MIAANPKVVDVKDVVTDPDDASNPTDDAMLAVLEDHKTTRSCRSSLR
jgi:hypothetical protein